MEKKKKLINVTEITEYLYCPRKVYLKKIKGLKEIQNEKMVSGMLKHQVFEAFGNDERFLVSEITENIKEHEILNIYRKHLEVLSKYVIDSNLDKIKQFNISPEKFLADINNFMNREFDIRIVSVKKALDLGFLGADLWKNLKPKYITELRLESEILGLRGRVDRLKIDDEIVPYELKTRKEIYDSDKIQLAAYALLLEEKYGQPVTKGRVESQEKEEDILITPELKDKVLKIAEEIRNMDSAPEFKLSNFNKCNYCSFNNDCFK